MRANALPAGRSASSHCGELRYSHYPSLADRSDPLPTPFRSRTALRFIAIQGGNTLELNIRGAKRAQPVPDGSGVTGQEVAKRALNNGFPLNRRGVNQPPEQVDDCASHAPPGWPTGQHYSTTCATRGFRAEVTGRQPALVEQIAPGLLVDQVERQVAARLQVVVQTRTRLPGLGLRRVVVVDHRGPPQAATGVVVVPHDHQPAILAHVHVALVVQVTVVVLDIGFQHPYPPQLVAHVLGVDVAGCQQVFICHLRRVDAIGVGRYVHLLLADDLPVVALARAVEDRSEERRVGEEGGSRWRRYSYSRR